MIKMLLHKNSVFFLFLFCLFFCIKNPTHFVSYHILTQELHSSKPTILDSLYIFLNKSAGITLPEIGFHKKTCQNTNI